MIPGPAQMGDSIGLEVLQFLFGLLPEGLKMGALDPVGAVKLLHHQLGIGQDLNAGGALLPGHLHPQNQGLIFRHVIGGFAEIPAQMGFKRAPGVIQEGAGSSRAGVAPGSAVAVEPPVAGLPAAVSVGHLLKEGLEFLAGEAELFQDLGDLQALGQGLEDRGPTEWRTLAAAQLALPERLSSKTSSSCQ